MPSAKAPRHWPEGLQYIDSYRFHASVTPAVRQFVQGTPSGKAGSHTPRALVVIRLISDPAHPACGQYGLFATRKIRPRSHILDYIGEIHCDDHPESDYDLSLHRFQDSTSIGVDARVMGNEARFINDYRGIRNKPNAEFVDGRRSGELRMGIWSAGEAIGKGEEVVVSYGKEWWLNRAK